MAEHFEFNIESEAVGLRLDVYLTKQLPAMSRAHVQKLLNNDLATVNDKVRHANYKLHENDVVCLEKPEPQSLEIKPEDLPLDILYEDHDLIVINKQRGMVVHPAAGNHDGTLVNALLAHCRDLSGINGAVRPGIVHRLDKDTSGVMVAAKNDSAHIILAAQIKAKTACRSYLAVVHGNIEEGHGIIDAPLGRHPTDRKKMAVVFTNSKHAVTHFNVLERFGEFTLIECILETGRTHQIRVHMAYIGHPVAGDPKYGPKTPAFSDLIAGQALHSHTLTLSHPSDGHAMSFVAPLPQDMEDILTRLRKHRREDGAADEIY